MLRYREGLRPLAKFVTHLCPLVNLTGNLTKDCVAFCKSELFPCQPWKMKWPKSIFNYQSYHLRNILYTVGTNKGFSLTFSISYKIAFNGEHRFKFFNFRNQYKQATTISWSPGLKPKHYLLKIHRLQQTHVPTQSSVLLNFSVETFMPTGWSLTLSSLSLCSMISYSTIATWGTESLVSDCCIHTSIVFIVSL